MQNCTDKELIEHINDRNSKALSILYERYNLGVFNFVLRYTNNREIAEEVLQETFVRIWYASHTYAPEKGSVKTWVFTIGLNITRNEMSLKRYSYQYVEYDDLLESENNGEITELSNPVDILENIELQDSIKHAISKLDPYLKEVVLLKHFHNLKFREIAEITETPEGTLKARFHKAINQLEKYLKKDI